MLIHLHSQATTPPKVRAAIQASDEPASVLAARFGTTGQTVNKWKHRDTVHDLSHTPHRLQIETEQETIQWIVSPSRADPGTGGGGGSPAQDAAGVARRPACARHWARTNGAFDGSLREFLNPGVSRSGLDRCLRRHGVGNLRGLLAQSSRPKHKAFKAYAPGYLHVDVKYLPQMADESSRRCLFVAIDRATRWVFVRVYKSKTAANARRLSHAISNAPARCGAAPS